MIKLAALLVIFNALDAFLTIVWVDCGAAYEANPLMNYFLQISPALFFGIKVVLVLSCVSIILRYKDRFLAKISLHVLFLIYAALIAYHAFHVVALGC
jgi:hypothetical protein